MVKKTFYMKRNNNQQSIKEAIDLLLRSYRLSDKMTELDAIKSWEQMMGKAIAKRTQEIYIKEKKLFLKITSAPLKEELRMEKTSIVKRINESVGKELIEDVFFL